ncbi:MAG: hypothetical protein AAGA72_02820 [Pseudomonadota bacterium]
MLRFFSFLLILIGAAALAYGGYQYLQVEQDLTDESLAASAEVFEYAEGDSAAVPPAITQSMSAGETETADDLFGPSFVDEEMMSALRTVPVAHETPSEAQFGRAFTVTLAMDATGDTTAADALSGTGNIVEGEARVSSTVRALVSGQAFDVEAITPDTQRVSTLTENVWRWRVTPTAVGTQELVIELFALVGEEALPLRTFRDDVDVRVSRLGQAIAIARDLSPITVVAGGIGSLLAGVFGLIGFFRRK